MQRLSRSVVRGLAVLAALAVPAPARALDLTNTWAVTVNLIGTTCNWVFTQTGADLTISTNGNCLPSYDFQASGTVDSLANTFSVDGTVLFWTTFPPQLAPITINATVAPSGTEFSGQTIVNGDIVYDVEGSLCRNGNLDPGEACDDGSAPSGCCTDTCTPEPDGGACGISPHDQCATGLACSGGVCVGTPRPAGTPCVADGNSCTLDQCDGAGSCTNTECSPCCSSSLGCAEAPHFPADCAAPASGGSVFLLETAIPDEADRLLFRLPDGVGPNATDFGDPTAATDYFLCVSQMTELLPNLILTVKIPAAGSCGAKPCWKQTRDGFRYRDRLRTPDGVTMVRLKNRGGRGAVRVVGGGANLSKEAFPLPGFVDPNPGLWVQLRTADRCWGAFYPMPEVMESGLIKGTGGE